MLQVVHGLGDTGAALGRAGVDKLAVIGSTATAKKVMATCAETLTPILAEGGGKDAMIVDADADLDAAATALWCLLQPRPDLTASKRQPPPGRRPVHRRRWPDRS